MYIIHLRIVRCAVSNPLLVYHLGAAYVRFYYFSMPYSYMYIKRTELLYQCTCTLCPYLEKMHTCDRHKRISHYLLYRHSVVF